MAPKKERFRAAPRPPRTSAHASDRTPQNDAKRTRELEASVLKLKQRCAEKQRELQNEQVEHERLSSIIEALT